MYVEYQINGNGAYNNMQAKIRPSHSPLNPGWVKGRDIFFLLKVFMLHINLKGMKCGSKVLV